MTNKIIAWVTLILTILGGIGWTLTPEADNWLFALSYCVSVSYLIIKYIETLK